jgi:hypothetical protein
VPRTTPASRMMCFVADHTAPSPPDASDGPFHAPPVNSSGGCARTPARPVPSASGTPAPGSSAPPPRAAPASRSASMREW